MSHAVDLIRTDNAAFLEACEDVKITELKIWACKIKDYTPLAKLKRLTRLEILNFSKGSFEVIGQLTALRYLRIIETPRGETSLDPLANLRKLTELSLESPPSWDSSRKAMVFSSLAPLAHLERLEKLVLAGVEVEADGLKPLWQLKHLREFRASNWFPMEEFALLAGHLPRAGQGVIAPFEETKGIPCKKCGGAKVMLTGVWRLRAFVCPACKKAKVEAHVEAFNELVRNASSTQHDCEQ